MEFQPWMIHINNIIFQMDEILKNVDEIGKNVDETWQKRVHSGFDHVENFNTKTFKFCSSAAFSQLQILKIRLVNVSEK